MEERNERNTAESSALGAKYEAALADAARQAAQFPHGHPTAVYTVIINGYDSIRGPFSSLRGYDFYCVTDDAAGVPAPWRPILVHGRGLEPDRLNRLFKFFPHRFLGGYRDTLYVDGNIAILRDPGLLVRELDEESPIVCIRHPVRTCAFDEAETCIDKKKDDEAIIRRQMEKYESEGFPRNFGLSQNNVIARTNQIARIDHLMLLWWNQLVTESRRDQLSLSYAAWKTGTPLKLHQNVRLLAKKAIESDAAFYHFPHRGSLFNNLRSRYKFVQRLIASAAHGQTRPMDLLGMLFRFSKPRRRARPILPRGTDA